MSFLHKIFRIAKSDCKKCGGTGWINWSNGEYARCWCYKEEE